MTEDHEEPILTDWDPSAVLPKETLTVEQEEHCAREVVQQGKSQRSRNVTLELIVSCSASADGSCTESAASTNTAAWLALIP
jgi:hypothetical protein